MTDERACACVGISVCLHVWEKKTRELTSKTERERERLNKKTSANRRRRRRRRAQKLVACVQTSGTSSRKHRETFNRSPCSNVRPQVIYSPSN